MTAKTFSKHVLSMLDEKGLREKVEKHKAKQLSEAKRQGIEDGYNNTGDTDGAHFEQKILYESSAMIANLCSTIEQWENDTSTHDLIIQSAPAQKKAAKEVEAPDERLFNTEYESHIRSVEIQKQEWQETIQISVQDIQEHEIEKQNIVASLGYRPVKTPSYKKVFHFVVLGLLCIAEMPLNYTSLANISDDLPILWCWALAAFISLVIGFAAHQAGKFLKNEEYALAGFPLSAIVLILVVILFLRGEDNGHMILVLINFSIAIVAVLSSFLAEEKKKDELDLYFLHEKAHKKKSKQLTKLKRKYSDFEINAENELMKKVRIHSENMLRSKAYKQAYESKRDSVVRIITTYKEQTVAQIKAHTNEVLYAYRMARRNAEGKVR